MNNKIYRSLDDIQNQANAILNGSPSISDVENFQKYSSELKSYILKNEPSQEVMDRLHNLPNIVSAAQNERKGILSIIIGGPFGFFFQEKRAIEEAKLKIANIKSIYASIDFIMKSKN